jgi:hypothetical protein
VAEGAGDEVAFALFKGWARLDGEDFGQATDAHLWHVVEATGNT